MTIHSGSRNFGKCIADYHQNIAVVRCNTPDVSKSDYIANVKNNFDKKDWQNEISRYTEIHAKYVPKGMEYLQGEDMYNYLVDMVVAQTYADFSRKVMMDEIVGMLESFGYDIPITNEEIITVHNFIDFDDWIIRKGAIRSYKGERMIVPFNMKEGLIIVEGKSNPDWNYSAPHGAGRVLSRSMAKSTLKQEDVDKEMEGVFTSCIPLDEAPGAYKDADIIKICIEPTCDIVYNIIPIINMKS